MVKKNCDDVSIATPNPIERFWGARRDRNYNFRSLDKTLPVDVAKKKRNASGFQL